jgi:hypothetical protein
MQFAGKSKAALLSRRQVMRALSAAAVAGLATSGASASSLLDNSSARISDGYADQQSYRPGDLVTLFLNSASPQQTTVRLFEYGGPVVYEVPADLFAQQPVGDEPWRTGFGYRQSAAFILPPLRSGVYLVEGIVPLIVKHDDPRGVNQHPDIVILYPTNTIAAYNAAGGLSMYSEPTPAPVVSFRRPVAHNEPNLAFFNAFLEWFATIKLPHLMGYVADIDLEDFSAIEGAKLLMVIGHSEYWTRRARENFDRFVAGGGHVLLLSGNNMWWQVRYSDDRSQLICYKRAPDPIEDPLLKTVNWTEPALEYPTMGSVAADFVHGGFGVGVPEYDGFLILAPNSPVFRGLLVEAGDVIEMRTIEYDGAPLLNDPVTEGLPRLDQEALGAYRAEIIAYQACSANENDTGSTGIADNVGTWIVYQRTATSGVVMNGASTNWCSFAGAFGPDGVRVRTIILNMIDILMTGKSAFST